MRIEEEAFADLVAPLQKELYTHCYRMLRSHHDAEDALQEAMLRAWRALPTFDGRGPLRAWLYRIASNVCLTAMRKRGGQAVVPIDESAEGSAASEPEAETHEAAAHAMTATLQLPPNQRAALILRDVLGFRAREAATTLGTTPASVNSALIRARANLHVSEPEAGDERLRDAVEGFVAALSRGDVDTLVGIASDTTLSGERSWAYSRAPVY
jgi:RNA polymerase sigma-70 factor (ECF subfamily)